MTRTGKIARLPLGLREQLNQRLANGVPGVELVTWLNSLPKVKHVLAKDFEGREITESNLSDWKLGGFVEWQAHREALVSAQSFAGKGRALKAAAQGPLADHLAMAVEVQYAQLLAGWNGKADAGFQRKLRGLRQLCQDAAVLRRGDHYAGRLRVAQDRLAYEEKLDGHRALLCTVKEVKAFPDVHKAFMEAFALRRRRLQERWKEQEAKRSGAANRA
ncbi:MAG TPA: hypothetical protein VK815_02250 [Candidatus Acidoferrales bacterium]|jgi:hypothetical protein|nr:hypothetical protein [Candidatus Acidoferrales bacterium]